MSYVRRMSSSPLRTIPFLSLAFEVALVTPAWSQIEARAPAEECQRVVKIDAITVKQKIKDGRTGQAEFYLEGEIGGRVTGRMVLVLESTTGSSVDTERTDFHVSRGILQYNQSDFDFDMWGTASVQTSAGSSSRPFASTLRVARDPAAPSPCSRSLPHADVAQPYVIGALWNGKTTTWGIDDWMTCALRNKEFVCSDLRPATAAKKQTSAVRPASTWYAARVTDATTLSALRSGNQGSGRFVVTVESNSELVRQHFNPKEISLSKHVPWQKATVATLPLQLRAPDGSTIRVVLRNAVLEKSAKTPAGPVAMETITIRHEGFER